MVTISDLKKLKTDLEDGRFKIDIKTTQIFIDVIDRAIELEELLEDSYPAYPYDIYPYHNIST